MAVLALLVVTPVAAQPAPQDYTIRFSTFLGGSDAEMVRDAAFDSQHNIYVAGGGASQDFPVQANADGFAFDDTQNGGWDVFVTKYDPSGAVVWSTYLGGPGYDRAYAIDFAPGGDLYVAGRASSDFPVTPGALQTTFGGGRAHPNDPYFEQDGFVCRIDTDGNVLACTYFGASDGRIIRDVEIGPGGEVFIAGGHSSGSYPEAIDQARLNDPDGASEDTFVAKLSADLSSVEWLRFINGSGVETTTASVATDAAGDVYVASTTDSPDLATAGAYDETPGASGTDVFVAKISTTGDLVWLTYVGGSGNELTETHELVVAGDGTATIAIYGDSPHASFARSPGTLERSYGPGGNDDIIVARLSPDGSTLLALAFFGGTADDRSEGSALDGTGAFYFTGNTASTNFPITANALQSQNSGTGVFVVKLSKSLQPVFASYWGGSGGEDCGRAIAADLSGNLSLGGQTSSATFTTDHAAQAVVGGGVTDGFVSMLQTPLSCGDADGDRVVSATDALAVLMAAVAPGTCDLCVCDLDATQAITATDALSVLRFAVGAGGTLGCVACP